MAEIDYKNLHPYERCVDLRIASGKYLGALLMTPPPEQIASGRMKFSILDALPPVGQELSFGRLALVSPRIIELRFKWYTLCQRSISPPQPRRFIRTERMAARVTEEEFDELVGSAHAVRTSDPMIVDINEWLRYVGNS